MSLVLRYLINKAKNKLVSIKPKVFTVKMRYLMTLYYISFYNLFSMKKLLILGILFLYVDTMFSQELEERKTPFSIAVSAHIKKYNDKINIAYEENDIERAKFLFDSLINNHLKGTYLDNFGMSQLKGESVSFGDFEKPIFLITYSSWCVPGVGEIPALNDLADKFHDQIDFLMLFWDTEEKMKEKIEEYSPNIQFAYINEKTNQDSHIINKLKHSLGFPMMYFMDADKKIIDIRKIVTHHSSESLSNSYNIHYNSLSKGVSLLMANLDATTIEDAETINPEESEEYPDEIEQEDEEPEKKKKKKRKKRRARKL